MILYVDSSSVISWHLEEPGRHELVRRAIEAADAVASSLLTYAEVQAGFARARREQRLTSARHARASSDFDRDWRNYAKIQATNRLVHLAGDLAQTHALKAYDAVHLASALTLRDRVPDTISFSTWDERLARAAASEGLERYH